jgi:ABC-2 type transport system permease protein
MKALDIAFKDMLRSWRSAFTVVMMFVAPLLITGLIYLAFGGFGGGEVNIAQIDVGLVNQDTAVSQVPVKMGEELAKILAADSLKNLLAVTEYSTEIDARQAILDKKINVALIIPPDFTSAVIQENASTALTIIHDPASTLAAPILQSIVEPFVNSLNGSKITAQVVVSQLEKDGLKIDANLPAQVAQSYGVWSTANIPGANGALPSVILQTPTPSSQGNNNTGAMAGGVMAGMIIYFAFYTGALNAQSIIREQDDQTLARLAVTPTSPTTILTGKVIGSIFQIAIQVLVLMLLSSWFFGINWGDPFKIGVVGLALVFLASGFGIFLMSFIKNMRQVGIVLGGALTVLGMLGGLFTTGFQNLPKAFEIAQLFTPHGWALRAFKLALGEMSGSSLVPALVMIAIGGVSLAIGILLFRRRFA